MTSDREPPSNAGARTAPAARGAKLHCKGVWKLFGPGAESFLAEQSRPPGAEEVARAGLIGAVCNASLEVGEGEIFVIMGLSGSGKSTIVRCLSRLIEPTAGEILFDGDRKSVV
jgi:glycine betaine/proline transport system ATP-binding protein